MAKILFAATAYLGHGGVETHLLTLLPEVAKHHQVVLLSDATPEFQRACAAAGIRWLQWSAPRVSDVAARRRLREVVAVEKPDIVHVQDARAAAIARLFLPFPRPVLFYTVHLAPYHYRGWGGWRERVLPWVYAQVERVLNACCTDTVIYVSHRSYEEALRRHLVPRSRALLLPNGIDLSPFVPTVPPEERQLVLCSVARLSPEKGVDVLLRAFALAMPRLPAETALWLIGDGPHRPGLERLAVHLGVERRVRFLGAQSHRAVCQCLRRSWAFVLLSRHETRSLAVMEAQAAGLPALVTDVGDNAMMVLPDSGFVVRPGRPKEAAAFMVELFQRREIWQKMHEAALRRAQTYDIRWQTAGFLRLYDSLSRPS